MPVWLIPIVFTSSGGRRSKDIDFSLLFQNSWRLISSGWWKIFAVDKFSSRLPESKNAGRIFDYTFLFKFFFKSCDFGPSWGIDSPRRWFSVMKNFRGLENRLEWREVAGWSGGGLRDGDVDFLFVFQGFWGVWGMEILIFHGLEGGCGVEILIFHWFFEAFWCAGGMEGDIDF